jgi:DNA-binding transcriptional MerR regulator
MDPLPVDELTRIERDYAGGVPAKVILEVFRPTGVALSQATFRKYVQAGLLPRSRRVGEKGKHRGSRGLYPVEVIRRLSAIKRMMSQGMTLEDIRGSFLVFRNQLDGVQRAVNEVLDSFSRELAARSFGPAERRRFSGELGGLRRRARHLIAGIARAGSAITSRPARS